MILQTQEDQQIVMSAVRYCMGRSTSMPHVCVIFLKETWPQLNDLTKQLVCRDMAGAVMDDMAGPADIKKIWNDFLYWAWPSLEAEQKRYIIEQTRWREKPFPVIEVLPGEEI